MIDIVTFGRNLEKGHIENCYLFCGSDEFLIRESIKALIGKLIKPEFIDLNYVKFDGSSLEDFDTVINACETLPFMSDKKVVLVYRASFMGEEQGYKSKLNAHFKDIQKYLKNVPEHCILIFYYVFKSKRDKPGRKIYRLDKDICIVKADRMRGYQLENRVQEFFRIRGRNIKKVELRLFCNLMEGNNLSAVENEVEKLCCYTYGRDIKREDIEKMFLKNSEEDIFDVVNAISNKNLKGALHLMDELIYGGAKINYILAMIERQFNMLFKIKLLLEDKKQKTEIMKILNIKSEYGYNIMAKQSKKFTLKQLNRSIQLCLNTEKNMKSLSVDEKTELELLLINTIA
ncbi:DNA polymerase III subunit delta [Clostridium luticellarii]|uniref:DNA polymerase III subunit delta n=1 Tax=Clostridium luticellarii TaxID=1691940 RepID=A0A2T0BM04_9CLOT|nr:DNA polymerase III subunit delta [Clostridium luticellarii]MCI1944121.1 DNA polymerase III subunit delta [Clostridium luticellarii]MCI1967237.1 DNA polymerase III subunit delta [Clostridium luticellarii]MCI1995148.1 DNA polymerase III subunit delta [Clostridium luticellarii]MCI2039356.1 DNA polymerase III subunit delta [Clostridium luticellarii]PRR84924.1 DNA polymerase III subunit delta [Clostridium luticellarii]